MRDYFWDNMYEFNIQHADIFLLDLKDKFDIVMSSGLIEHFKGAELKRMIAVHKKYSRKYICFIVPHACDYEIEFAKSKECKRKYGYQKPFTTKELYSAVVDKNWEDAMFRVFYNDRLLVGIFRRKNK